jgi:SAM-dependent methyltransferase
MKNVTPHWSKQEALFLLKINPNQVTTNELNQNLFIKKCYHPANEKAAKDRIKSAAFLQLIMQSGFIACGVEQADCAITEAMNKTKLKGINMSYQKGKAEKLPYAKDSFNAVFCLDVLEHVKNAENFMQELLRVLQPGGVLFFDTANKTEMPTPIELKVIREKGNCALKIQKKHQWAVYVKPSVCPIKKPKSFSFLETSLPFISLADLYLKLKNNRIVNLLIKSITTSDIEREEKTFKGYAISA